jgi:hypothetical protein
VIVPKFTGYSILGELSETMPVRKAAIRRRKIHAMVQVARIDEDL